MKNKIFRVLIGIVVIVITFSAGLWLGISFEPFKEYILNAGRYNSSSSENISENTESKFSVKPVKEAIDLVSKNALDKKSKEELLSAAVNSILSNLDDEYTEYFTTEEYEKIMESYSGIMSGIGIVITLNDEEQVVVVLPLDDTPAYRAGIMEGDIIIEVNGGEIKEMALEKVVTMIKGEEGTKVDLKIYRPLEDKTIELTITRAKFLIPNLVSEVIENDVGYIWYYTFQDKGAQQLDREIQKLTDSGAEGIILDLRNNLGGVLNDAVKVCDLFLDEGKIVTVKGRLEDKEVTDEYFAKGGKYAEIPLVVLINGFSASASEVVAGALKDNGRAVLVGEKSFGKGLVQALYELSDGSGIKFTTARYFLPSGVSIEGVGIKPDITVELEPDSTEDTQLIKAAEEIEALISET